MATIRLLLPSLEVVAISQAPSPEPNPNSPLPVITMVVQYTTIKLIGQKLDWSIVATRAHDSDNYLDSPKTGFPLIGFVPDNAASSEVEACCMY